MMRWSPKLPLLDRLRSTEVETIYHEQTVGFLGQDAHTERREVSANVDGEAAAQMIENLLLFVQHDTSCRANDLDYLDHTPCTCGLRKWHNPKGADA